MTRQGKEKVTDEMRKNELETTDEQAAKSQRILANPPPIQRFLMWSLVPSTPSTIPPPCQWSWSLPTILSVASGIIAVLCGQRIPPCRFSGISGNTLSLPVPAYRRSEAGYHFSDYTTLRVLILASPPPIMRSDGTASTQAPRPMGPPHPAASDSGGNTLFLSVCRKS